MRGIFLYIPLRSDKTSTILWTAGRRRNFISHYVQIKLGLYHRRRGCGEGLYIPLRSDKTHFPVLLFQRVTIFISHYVQIKLGDNDRIFAWDRNFISHYVQIKRGLNAAGVGGPITFISHYVQIKLPDPNITDVYKIPLYPTTFR